MGAVRRDRRACLQAALTEGTREQTILMGVALGALGPGSGAGVSAVQARQLTRETVEGVSSEPPHAAFCQYVWICTPLGCSYVSRCYYESDRASGTGCSRLSIIRVWRLRIQV